jgi:hypothetical protein
MAIGDHEVTQVDAESAQHFVLVFSHDTIINATLWKYPTGEPVYRIKTNDTDSKTDFYEGGSIDKTKLVGTLKSQLLGRTVTRRGEKIKLGKWIEAGGTYLTSVTDL